MTGVQPLPSPNHDERPAGTAIDLLLLHYTGMRSAEEALARLCDPAAKVSAHYVVCEDGTILALVPEERRAWHAGQSFWRGRTDTNARSIGVEIVNPGHEFGYRPFPGIQMAAVRELCADILSRHAIPAANVLGHSDVAPARKEDPGELFDWRMLAGHGIGLWPRAGLPAGTADPTQSVGLLGRYGYDTSLPPRVILSAFQRHFRPRRIDGLADAETFSLILDLLSQSGR